MLDRFSRGNRKLFKGILIWNLPRLITCPGAGSCKDWCYETKIEKMYKNVLPFRQTNFDISLSPLFATNVIDALNNAKYSEIRVHESGDFYNQEYLEKWKTIARHCPAKNFYAYTKSLHLDLWTNLPSNFNLIQSFGGKWDYKIDYTKPTYRVAGATPPVGSVREIGCPFYSTNSKCGTTCRICIEDKACHVVVKLH